MGTFGSGLFGVGGGSSGPTTLGVPFSGLLYRALRKAGVTRAPGRGPSPEQYADAISEINSMVGGWNLNPLLIFSQNITPWPTVAGKQSYTIGQDAGSDTPADWDGPRPQMITFANLIFTDSEIRRKIHVYDDEKWSGVSFQNSETLPSYLYNDGNVPFSRIYLYPIPDAVYQIELYTWQALQCGFTSIEDRVILPMGWEDAIVNNAAVRLASMPWPNQRKMDPQVLRDAMTSLALLQSYNASSPRLKSDPELTGGGGGTYNYLSGLNDL